MGCGNSPTTEAPNLAIIKNPEEENKEKIQKLMNEINIYRYGFIRTNYPTYDEIINKDFNSIEEMEKYLKGKIEEKKDQYSDIYYLFALYCWLSKKYGNTK